MSSAKTNGNGKDAAAKAAALVKVAEEKAAAIVKEAEDKAAAIAASGPVPPVADATAEEAAENEALPMDPDKPKLPQTFYCRYKNSQYQFGQGKTPDGKDRPVQVIHFRDHEFVATNVHDLKLLLEHELCGIEFHPVNVDIPKDVTKYIEGIQTSKHL